MFDGEVVLVRGEHRDEANHEFAIERPTILVAIVDERGTDVTLHLKSGAAGVAVESQLEGDGLEIATLRVTQAGKAVVSLDGPRAALHAGRVKLTVLEVDAETIADPVVAAKLRAWQAWSLGTRANVAAERVRKDTLPAIDAAIGFWEGGPAADARLAAMGHLLRARTIYYHEIDWSEARAEADRAAVAFSAPGVADSRYAARARLLAVASLLETSFDATARNPTAAEADGEVRRSLNALSRPDSGLDEIGIGRAFNLLGLADLFAHQWSQARISFEVAVHHYDKAGYRAGALQSRRNLALLATYRGDLPLASKLFTECIADVQWIDEADLRASLYTNAGTAAAEMGDSDTAISRFMQAERIGREAALPRAQARALQGLGLEYYDRGDLEQANTFLRAGLELRRRENDAQGMFGSLRAVGALQRASGDPDGARRTHEETLTRANNPVMRMRALVELALDESVAGHSPVAINHLRDALREKLESMRHPAVAEVQIALAERLLETSVSPARVAEARVLAQGALDVSLRSQDLLIEMNARRVLAEADVAEHHVAHARDQLERAIALALRYRRFSSSDELRASALASQHQVFQDMITLLMDGSEKRGSPHRASRSELKALRVLESARALMFSTRRSTSGAAGRINEALATLAAKRASIATLLERAAPPRGEIETLQRDGAAIRSEIDRLRAGSGVEPGAEPHDSGFIAADIQPAPGHAQISYLLGSERSFIWERTPDGTRVWVLPERAQEPEARVGALLEQDRLQDPASFDARLFALSETLMPRGLGGESAMAFDIVADGVLTRIPFAALRSPTLPARRLIETHVISMVPSLLERQAPGMRSHKWSVITLLGTDTLPGADAEARMIAANADSSRVLALGKGADDALVLARAYADGADVLHVATHGRADAGQPLSSRLTVSSGYITAGQILEWQGDVGLVFLSACDTAVGRTRFGDSTPGLQRAFLRAGARNVIATLWPIEDRMAAAFSRDFYGALNAGMSAQEALARTQRAWLASSSAASGQMLMRRRVAAWAYVMYAR